MARFGRTTRRFPTAARLRARLQPAGRRYLAAMQAAANFAWANRQVMTGLAVRRCAARSGSRTGTSGPASSTNVCHNVAKLEDTWWTAAPAGSCPPQGGHPRLRAGDARVRPPTARRASRSSSPGTWALLLRPRRHRPGHGGDLRQLLPRGRPAPLPPRGDAAAKGRAIHRELADRGIEVMARGKKTLAEEMSDAYKDVSRVVGDGRRGVSRLVARLEPMGVIKG